MEEKVTKQLERLADILISTLGSMDPKEADKKVAGVAQHIYRDILKRKGQIQRTRDIYACGGSPQHIVEYEWFDDEEGRENEMVSIERK